MTESKFSKADLHKDLTSSLSESRKECIRLNGLLRKLKSLSSVLKFNKDTVGKKLDAYVAKIYERLQAFRYEMRSDLDKNYKSKLQEMNQLKEQYESRIDQISELCERAEKLIQFGTTVTEAADKARAEEMLSIFSTLLSELPSGDNLAELHKLEFRPLVSEDILTKQIAGSLITDPKTDDITIDLEKLSIKEDCKKGKPVDQATQTDNPEDSGIKSGESSVKEWLNRKNSASQCTNIAANTSPGQSYPGSMYSSVSHGGSVNCGLPCTQSQGYSIATGTSPPPGFNMYPSILPVMSDVPLSSCLVPLCHSTATGYPGQLVGISGPAYQSLTAAYQGPSGTLHAYGAPANYQNTGIELCQGTYPYASATTSPNYKHVDQSEKASCVNVPIKITKPTESVESNVTSNLQENNVEGKSEDCNVKDIPLPPGSAPTSRVSENTIGRLVNEKLPRIDENVENELDPVEKETMSKGQTKPVEKQTLLVGSTEKPIDEVPDCFLDVLKNKDEEPNQSNVDKLASTAVRSPIDRTGSNHAKTIETAEISLKDTTHSGIALISKVKKSLKHSETDNSNEVFTDSRTAETSEKQVNTLGTVQKEKDTSVGKTGKPESQNLNDASDMLDTTRKLSVEFKTKRNTEGLVKQRKPLRKPMTVPDFETINVKEEPVSPDADTEKKENASSKDCNNEGTVDRMAKKQLDSNNNDVLELIVSIKNEPLHKDFDKPLFTDVVAKNCQDERSDSSTNGQTFKPYEDDFQPALYKLGKTTGPTLKARMKELYGETPTDKNRDTLQAQTNWCKGYLKKNLGKNSNTNTNVVEDWDADKMEATVGGVESGLKSTPKSKTISMTGDNKIKDGNKIAVESEVSEGFKKITSPFGDGAGNISGDSSKSSRKLFSSVESWDSDDEGPAVKCSRKSIDGVDDDPQKKHEHQSSSTTTEQAGVVKSDSQKNSLPVKTDGKTNSSKSSSVAQKAVLNHFEVGYLLDKMRQDNDQAAVGPARVGVLQAHWLRLSAMPGAYMPLKARLLFKCSADLHFPIGVTSNSCGEIIVGDTGHNTLKLFSQDGSFLSEFGNDISPPLKRPSALVVNEANELFVKDDICIRVFDRQGNFLRNIGKNLFRNPFGLSISPDGQLVILETNLRNPCLVYISQDGSCVQKFPYTPLLHAPRMTKCRFMGVYQNNVIVSDLGASKIYLTTLDGHQIGSFGSLGSGAREFREPSGISVDQCGNIAIGDSKNNRVQIYRYDGAYTCSVEFDEKIVRPSDIHLTADNRLLVVNYLHNVVKAYQLQFGK